jgi:hypothetical protein
MTQRKNIKKRKYNGDDKGKVLFFFFFLRTKCKVIGVSEDVEYIEDGSIDVEIR